MQNAAPQMRGCLLAPRPHAAMILAMRTGVALGSNLGDRLANLRAARDFLLSMHEGGGAAAVSPVYETDPVDCPPEAPPFLNAVVEIETSLQPARLLELLAVMEQRLGRPEIHGSNWPRTVDADILYADDLILDSGPVILPHPRMTSRRFVMQPLADIRPGLKLTGWHGDARQMLECLPRVAGVKIFAVDW